MRIAIGSDHGGFALKQDIIAYLMENGHEITDFGCMDTNAVDYPDIAAPVANAVIGGAFDKGILVCGTGIGMSIAANKVKGIRAALCENPFSARMAGEHNNAHILCLGGRVLGPSLACEMVEAFLGAGFVQRHQTRLDKIAGLES